MNYHSSLGLGKQFDKACSTSRLVKYFFETVSLSDSELKVKHFCYNSLLSFASSVFDSGSVAHSILVSLGSSTLLDLLDKIYGWPSFLFSFEPFIC